MHRAILYILAGIVVVTIAGFSLSSDHPSAKAAAAACSASGSVSASLVSGGPFDGLWKYTITGSWDTGGEGLSHISFLITYACDCCPVSGLVYFDTPAGTSTGVDSLGNPCTAEYVGLGDLCGDDPTIGNSSPALKFEQNDTACEADMTGTGTWCFYSPLPPLASATYTGAVAVKYGNNQCFGDLTGEMPDCLDCQTIPTRNMSWGDVKAKFEKR